jgi:hypothetical protein
MSAGDGVARLTSRELAVRERVSPVTVRRWRATGYGPPWERIGRKILYPVDSVVEWEMSRRGAPWSPAMGEAMAR